MLYNFQLFYLDFIKTSTKSIFSSSAKKHLPHFCRHDSCLAKNWKTQKVKNESQWQQCTQVNRGNLMLFVVMGFRFLAPWWQILQLVIYRDYHKKLSFVVLKSAVWIACCFCFFVLDKLETICIRDPLRFRYISAFNLK